MELEESYFHSITNIAGKQEDDILVELLANIEENIGDKMTKRETRNLFKIITEIIQNVQKHAIPDKVNLFEIGYDENKNVVISSSNFATKKHATNISNFIAGLEGLDKAGLEGKFTELLQSSIPKDPSMGLGIMTIKNISISYRYRIVEIEEDLYSIKLKLLY